MKGSVFLFSILLITFLVAVSFKETVLLESYKSLYFEQLSGFDKSQQVLLQSIEKSDLKNDADISRIRSQINEARLKLKSVDFWLRYLEPISYKKINGPLPAEWETEVFEKFEAPYKREGAGLTLAALYLDEDAPNKVQLSDLIKSSVSVLSVYNADSITNLLKSKDHFYLCNRLFLLNLAAIYTTGFECPDTAQIIPELKHMLVSTYDIYTAFNQSFESAALPQNYLDLYKKTIAFVGNQKNNYLKFDHFSFIKDYINPLFSFNQKLIRDYNVVSKSNVDYSLNKNNVSIFNKDLYRAQNAKGIFLRVNDKETLAEIEKIGKLLFYDPLLSGNNLRSCASCHNPRQYFTDTSQTTALQFDRKNKLARNAPSLLSAEYNHLLMLDGKHISLQNQAKDVITNNTEMACSESDIVEKVLSCNEYKTAFKKFLKFTPQEPQVTVEHISSAITYYYSRFGHFYSPFDKAMNQTETLNEDAKNGFNLFMGKAQCATCHFVPQFNGVKPPYVGSEFEVLGVAKDTTYRLLSEDKGRFGINPAMETDHAFRTGSIRNADYTKPYMHNGSMSNLSQVIDFYNAGGGVGKGLKVDNQTLSADSLHLTNGDKKQLLAFISSLNEAIQFENPPEKLPTSKMKSLNKRQVGGEY